MKATFDGKAGDETKTPMFGARSDYDDDLRPDDNPVNIESPALFSPSNRIAVALMA